MKRNPFDVALTCIAVLQAVGLAGFPVVGSAFARMFEDLGGEIPLVTRMAISVWFPLSAAAVVLATVAGAWMVGKTSALRVVLVGVVVASFFLYALLGYGLYAPIFALAGQIR